MEQASKNTEHNLTNRIIGELVRQDEVVNHIGNTTNNENNVQVKHEEVNHIDNTTNNEHNENNVQVNHEDVKHEEVVNHIENTTRHENIVEEPKQAKIRTKAKPNSKAKPHMIQTLN